MTTENTTQPQHFVLCDAHPATGGPHQSRGVFVGWNPTHTAWLWACTHRSRKGTVCGSVQVTIPPSVGRGTINEAQEMWNRFVAIPELFHQALAEGQEGDTDG